MEEKDYPFEFSVVMAVYNVEPFLREAVDSLVAQDFGFENIQLIFVDDGSPDNSGIICDEYARQYPENVVVIHKENGGLSSARNAGVRASTGKYINFIDPDDRMDPQVFSAVHQFFCAHEDEVDVVAIPIMMFGTQQGPHPSNSKFKKGNRVIDLDTEWWSFHMQMASTFLKASAAKQYCFQEDLIMACAEDSKELIKLFLRNPKLGVVNQGSYRYRKRDDSLVGVSRTNPLWYVPYLRDYSQWAIEYSIHLLGYVPKNVQFTIMYDLQWKLRQQKIPEGVLSDEEILIYQSKINAILHYIEDDVVMRQKEIWTEHKAYVLTNNHGCFPEKLQLKSDVMFAYGNVVRFWLKNIPITLEFVKLNKECITVEGWMRQHVYLDQNSPDLIVKANGVEVYVQPVNRPEEIQFAGQVIARRIGFQFSAPLRDIKSTSIQFFCRTEYGDVRMKEIRYGKYFAIHTSVRSSYYCRSDWKLTGNKEQLKVSACGRKGRLLSEFKLYKELWKSKRKGTKKAIFARIAAQVIRKFKRRQIWLVCDKAVRADDNGEALFKYLQAHKSPNRKVYFLVGKNSSDYTRISKIGSVAPYMSWQHKLLFLVSDYIISAYSHDELNNPFIGYHTPYRDLMQDYRYIFLQHGITKDDISVLVNRTHKNFCGFVTSTERERNSILETPAYLYRENEVWLTGLPRWDYLYHAEENSVAIMPTWRRELFGSYDAKSSKWSLKPGFENSDYFQFYQSLINHERLLSRAKEMDYRIVFVPHPVIFPYIDRFPIGKGVEVGGNDTVYRDVFAKSKLLVTDFSSVAFDFAYLQKPVIYAHFDRNHYAEGYFDYERDGFGEVEYNLEGVVDRIIEYMENDCRLKEEYRQRIESFFTLRDQNNCRRVYEKILELDKQD